SLKDLTHYPIRAPFDGVIVKKNVANGDWLKDDAEIYVVADLSTVWAEIIVYPSDLESVRLGQKAIIKATSSDMVTNGQVSYIDSVIGDESRTARARVVLENPDGKWRPGLFVKVEIIKEEQTVPVAVRNDAIQNYHDKPVVFVRYEDTFEARPIKLGRSDGHFTQIIAGLSPGESYVTKNSYILKSELGKSSMSHQH
ncbi:MAG: efflux RND transporter periplasmic adaptor subunit, partial [Syntrophaceae bacterium]|nr:efflux RND transporter periplasmic adaptor subunit [Syntrophaceae bacterium]